MKLRHLWILPAFLSLGFLGSAAWADQEASSCADSLLNGAQLAKKKGDLLRSTERWEKFMGRRVSETEFRRGRMAFLLDTSLKFDSPYVAINSLKSLFYDTYLAFHLYKLAKTPEDQATNAKIIAQHIDEYESAFGMLTKVASGTHPSAASAKKVLDKLQAKYLLNVFFQQSGIAANSPESVFTPTLEDLHRVINENPEIDLWRLRQIRRREVFSALLALSPSQALFSRLLSLAGGMPFINKDIMKAFLMGLDDERIRYVYYPDIQRIAASTADSKEKAEMLMILNAGTDNELLITFVRRIDLQDQWTAIKAELADPKYQAQIAQAESVASRLGPMALEGRSLSMKIVARFVDVAVFAAAGYFAAHHGFGFGHKVAKGRSLASIKVKPQPQIQFLTTEEEILLDRVLDDVETVAQQL